MRLLDVCAGIGGFSLAATWAGYEVAGQIEIDPWCRRVLEKHWPAAIRMADVFEVRGDEFGPIDLLTAGIPCQPYSVAGKRRGADDDRAIWPAVRDVIAVAQPPRVLIENVAGFIGMALDGVSADLEALGYETRAFVVPACAVGAPHRRDRVWILADAARITEREPADEANAFAASGEAWALAGGRGSDDADPDGAGLEGRIERAERAGERPAGSLVSEPQHHAGARPEALSGMGDAPDGLPGRLAHIGWRVGPDVDNPWAGDWEAGCPRTTTHEQDRVHKLKALGNAIVPSVAYTILKLWDESEESDDRCA